MEASALDASDALAAAANKPIDDTVVARVNELLGLDGLDDGTGTDGEDGSLGLDDPDAGTDPDEDQPLTTVQ